MVEPVNDNILNLVNELYNNLDAKDKIINEQALEIARLKEELENDIDRYEDTISYQLGFDKGKEYLQQRIDKAIEYIKPYRVIDKNIGWLEFTLENKMELLEILVPKGFSSYEDYKKKEEAFINHFCKGDKE